MVPGSQLQGGLKTDPVVHSSELIKQVSGTPQPQELYSLETFVPHKVSFKKLMY